MMIRTEGEPRGRTNIHVEEYKRPKFQVTLDAPKNAPKLSGLVSLQGKATAYTGAAIGDAKVRYHVVREVRYPIWWGYYFWWRQPNSNSQEIAHGTAITAADGTFTIEFTAKPDLSVAEKDEPIFHYEISADVTDTTGETRSASHGVVVGYTALQASLAADEWQTDDKPVEITITTQSLDGEAKRPKARSRFTASSSRKRSQRPDIPGINQFTAGRARASRKGMRQGGDGRPEPTPDPPTSTPGHWASRGRSRAFTTDAAGKTTVKFKLAAGPYRAVLETQDRFGKKVTARAAAASAQARGASSFPIECRISSARRSGRSSRAKNSWPCGAPATTKARAYIEIEHRHKIIKSFWTEPGATQQPVKLAVTEAMRGGFTLHVTMVRENRAYLDSRHVDVPWTNKELDDQVGALRLEARTGAEGNLDGGHHRTGREEGGRGDGRHALRRIAGRLPAASAG